jgi:hypothetical protein
MAEWMVLYAGNVVMMHWPIPTGKTDEAWAVCKSAADKLAIWFPDTVMSCVIEHLT